jgi:hypothetical protein
MSLIQAMTMHTDAYTNVRPTCFFACYITTTLRRQHTDKKRKKRKSFGYICTVYRTMTRMRRKQTKMRMMPTATRATCTVSASKRMMRQEKWYRAIVVESGTVPL